MTAKELVLVGKFGAAHGIKGEVRLQSFTGDPAAIGRYGPLSDVKGRQFKLTSLRPVKADLFVARVDGIKDRTAAEALVNVELFVSRAALPPPEEDEFYLTDLIGLDARDPSGVRLGTILNVLNFGGGDILEVVPEGGGETWLLPFTKEVVPEIDLARRQVIIVPPVEIDASADEDETAAPAEPQGAALGSGR
jgi:16S rRNA processing protein RimM